MRRRIGILLVAVGIAGLLAFLVPRVSRTRGSGSSTLVVGLGAVPWLEIERQLTLTRTPDGGWSEDHVDAVQLEPVHSTFGLGLVGILALLIARRLRRGAGQSAQRRRDPVIES